jgi:ribosomal small subunit protein bTHX
MAGCLVQVGLIPPGNRQPTLPLGRLRRYLHAIPGHVWPEQIHSVSGVFNMGKGDARSKRGKIFKGSFGKKRPNSRQVAKQAKQARQ